MSLLGSGGLMENCKRCDLEGGDKVYSKWGDSPKVLLVGEAPGSKEVELGEPFVGPAGRCLAWGLSQAGLSLRNCFKTNLILCKLPQNDMSSDAGESARANCMERFIRDVDKAIKMGIKVIVPLGNYAAKAFGIEESISKVRGSVYTYKGLPVIPTYHPAFIVRFQYGSGVSGKQTWIRDFKKVKSIVDEGWKEPEEHFLLKPSLEDVRNFVDVAVNANSMIAVDIEATALDVRKAKIVVIGLATSSTEAISVPILNQGGISYWSEDDMASVKILLNRLFSKCNLVFQNCFYDVPILRRNGFEIPYENITHDTLILHHTIDPEMPHNLGYLVSIYGRTPYWKGTLLNRDTSITEMDAKELRTYNLRDCVVLHQILPKMLQEAQNTDTIDLYMGESMQLVKPIMKMSEYGILVSGERVQKYKESLENELRNVEEELRNVGKLPESLNLDSGDDIRYFLYGVEPSKFKKLKELCDPPVTKVIVYKCCGCGKAYKRKGKGKSKCCNSDFMLVLRKEKKELNKNTKKYKELLRLKELRDCVESIYIPTSFSSLRRTDTNKLSIDAGGRLSFQRHVQNRLSKLELLKNRKIDEEEKCKKLLGWLKGYGVYKKLQKLLTTYTKFDVWDDGRVHSSFSTIGTRTRRLSSRNPNMQNIPKSDDIRSLFVVPSGHVWMSFDYSQLEIVVLAYMSGDQELIEIIESGTSLHDENTKTLFKIDDSSEDWKVKRKVAKIFQFASIQYGGSDNEIYKKIITELPEVGLTFAEFKRLKDNYFKRFKGMKRWQESVKKLAMEQRVSYFGLGGRRVLVGELRDIQKQGLNTPIQGTAAQIINRATIKVDRAIEERGLKSRMISQVHDELNFEVVESEIKVMKELVKSIMEEPVKLRNGRICRVGVTTEIGQSWGQLSVER